MDSLPGILLDAAQRLRFAERYYDLCERFPERLEWEPCPSPTPKILTIMNALGPSRKLPGPGRAFEFALQAPSELTVVIQGRTTVEVFISAGPAELSSTFAVLAAAIHARSHSGSLPYPPYPRPEFFSLQDLASILRQVHALGTELITAWLAAAPAASGAT